MIDENMVGQQWRSMLRMNWLMGKKTKKESNGLILGPGKSLKLLKGSKTKRIVILKDHNFSSRDRRLNPAPNANSVSQLVASSNREIS